MEEQPEEVRPGGTSSSFGSETMVSTGKCQTKFDNVLSLLAASGFKGDWSVSGLSFPQL